MNQVVTESPSKLNRNYFWFLLIASLLTGFYAFYAAGFEWPKDNFHIGLLLFSICLLLITLFIPKLARFIYSGWIALGSVLQIVNSFILLFIIYSIVVNPIRLFRRLLKNQTNFEVGKTLWSEPENLVTDPTKQF